jgi:hypothetical protein
MDINDIEAYLSDLFEKAFKSDPFDMLCTILRVKGLSDAKWDPFEESLDSFNDYSWLIEESKKARGDRCVRRISLLVYCQMIEMSALHEMLANLLRCISGKPYILSPFFHLQKKKKKELLSWIPPSASVKFRELRKLAENAKDDKLPLYIDSFFNEKVRNAFSHSDYILTDSEFRYTEGGPAQSIKLSDLDAIINSCFVFYRIFMDVYRKWRFAFSQLKRFHKWPNYEVLEILSDKEDGVFGFHVHFSNGSKTTYTRRRSGTQAINMGFNPDGTLYFMVGCLDKLESVWKVDGKPVTDWDALER